MWLSCALVMLVFLCCSGVNRYKPADLAGMIQGTARKPFVYRQLVPLLVRAMHAVTPRAVDEAVYRASESSESVARCFRHFRLAPASYVDFLLAVIVAYLFLVGFAIVFRSLMAACYGADWRASLAGVVAPLSLLPFFGYGYLYDFSTLFFATALLAAIVCARWAAFVGLFALACVNKETAALFILPFAWAAWGTLRRRSYFGLLAAQLAIFGLVRAVTARAYATNRGAAVEWHLPEHLEQYARWSWAGAASVVAWVLVAYFGTHGWDRKPLAVKRSLVILVPLVPLYLVGGCPFEWRAFYDAFPILLLLVAHGVHERFRGPWRPIGPRAETGSAEARCAA